MVGKELFTAKWITLVLLFAAFLPVAFTGIANGASAGSSYDFIIGNTLGNSSVANYIISNTYAMNYLLANPETLGYFLNFSMATNSVLNNPSITTVTMNGSSLVYFMSNPSFGSVLQNYPQFNNFVGSGNVSGITANHELLTCLLANPSLATVAQSPSTFYSFIAQPGMQRIENNTNEYASLLCNPALAAIAANGTSLSSFASSSSSTPITGNPAAFTSLLGNPALQSILANPNLTRFMGSSGSASLMSNPQFIIFMSNPAFNNFLNTGATPTQVSGLMGNSALSAITSNSIKLAALLGNPGLASVIANQAALASMLSTPSLNPITGNPAVLTTLLSNPALGAVLGNESKMVSFMSQSSLAPVTTNPGALTLLFSNPALGGVMANPAGLGTVFSNPMMQSSMQNPQVFSLFLTTPALAQIVNNPNTFVSLMTTTQLSNFLYSPQQMFAFINNPAFGGILASPGAMTGFLQSPNTGTIVNNPYLLGSLVGNPSLGTVINNPAQVGSIMTNPALVPITNNSYYTAQLLGNPGLAGIASNQGQLASFIGNPAFVVNGNNIFQNSAVFAPMLSNPSLITLMANPSMLSGFLANPSYSNIAGNPALLGGLFANPQLGTLLGNPTYFNTMLGSPGMGPILGNPAAFANFLSNPSMVSILGNPAMLANLGNIATGAAFGQFVGSPSFVSMMSNPLLGSSSMLGNPAAIGQLASLVSGNPAALPVLGNPAFASLFGSPALASLLNNPGAGAITANPATESLLSNPLMSGLLGAPTATSFFNNPSLSNLMANTHISSVLGSSALGTLASNPGLNGLFTNSQLNNIFSGGPAGAGLQALTSSGGLLGSALSGVGSFGGLGIPGIGACPLSTPYFGFCTYVNTTVVETDYTSFAGSGQITSLPPISLQSPTPLIETVLSDNQQNGQWLITCPVTPNSANTQLYFTTSANSFIGGNRCLADITPLLTPINLYTFVWWTPFTVALADNYYTISNIANGWVYDIAYSGQTQTSGGAKYNISNGYSTESYIFDQVPSSTQHGLWSWSAKYVNLKKTDLTKLQFTQEYDNLQLVIPFVCIYNYNYKVTSAIASINNTNISVPQVNNSALKSGNWFNYSGYLYSPVKTLPGGDTCYYALLLGQELQNGGASCGGWTKVSTNGTIEIGGVKYSGLNIYYGSANTASGSYATTPKPMYSDTLLAAYANGYAEVNAWGLNFTNVSILPYINYQLSIPASATPLNNQITFYNQTYGVYTPHNYATLGNSLDELPMYGGTEFFATYNGYLTEFPFNVVSIDYPDPNSLTMAQDNFLSNLNQQQAALVGFGVGANGHETKFGSFVYGRIYNPQFITASPNGYVYVIASSTTCGLLCFISSTTTTYIYTFKFIPQGYYNFTNYQPAAIPFTDNAVTWNTNWKNYFASTFLSGSQNLYLVGISQLSSVRHILVGFKINNGGALYKFTPLAAQTDTAGDLFLVGDVDKSGAFAIAALTPPGSGNYVENDIVAAPPWFLPSGELAVSPGGQFVYVGNVSYNPSGGGLFADEGGGIEVYKTSPQGGPRSGVASNAFTYVGNIPLSYSNDTYDLNIIAYLANGGPYNDTAVKNAYKPLLAQGVNVPDTSNYHHPVAIADSQGILYVLDNWSFVMPQQASYAHISILMLRAFSANGVEIPVDQQDINDFVPKPGQIITSLPTGVTPTYGWAPYGWPLSASVSIPNGGTETYCALDCQYGPFDTNTPYPPIGPRTDALDGHIGPGANTVGMYSDFNGTLYLIAHAWQFGAGGTNWCWNPQVGFDCGSSIQPKKGLYTELLAFRPKIQNYTKLDFMANDSDYTCYLNVSPPNPDNNPCIYNANTAMIQYISPPVLGIPDSFGYAESLGTPQQYLNVQNQLSSLFPKGIETNNYYSQTNQELNTGLGTANYNTLATGPLASGTAPSVSLPGTYLRSSLNGYAVVPYNVTLILNQSWTDTGLDVPLNPLFPVCPPIFGTGISVSSKTTSYKYQVTPLSSKSGPLNQTIEGGSTYLQYLPQQTNYVQNLSDAGLIISPYINYQLYTNRLPGEIYINQTISPQSAATAATSRGAPVVINAAHNYNYQTQLFQQVSSFGTNYGYETQIAIPSASTGASCGVICQPNYYYDSNYFTDTSKIQYYNENITQFFQLFNVFQQSSHLANLVLNLTTATSVLGYNRLLYTYVDRFNNTVSMPLDVNLANITVMTLTADPLINPSNENQTSVTVQGTATYTTPIGTHPIPSGSNIYLYWNYNINYYNSTSSPSGSGSGNPSAYYKWALLCTLAPTSKSCALANPLSTQTQKQPDGAQEASQIDYHTEAGLVGGCPKQPKSLLTPIVYDCNIFSNTIGNVIRNDPNNPSVYQYCIPVFPNGTGLFTSQLGLIGVTQTDGSGNFHYTFNACGVGQNRVIAVYYGNPPPEPLDVSQTWLGASGGSDQFSGQIDQNDILAKVPEYDYSDAPNYTTTQFEIGSYVLSYGTIGIASVVALVGIVAIIAFLSMGRKRRRRRVR
ncbi:MAG: hypothetical protein KGI06_01390 [Candidatus Micrarchaeota archaeon]|nr:hypothetical protein [Candidatus Micrarchaeota archaeon]